MDAAERIRQYFMDEYGVTVRGDPVGFIIASHRALSTARHMPLPDVSDGETTYRFCLDVLIATIYEWRRHNEVYRSKPFAILRAQMRAGELAGRLFDKWIGEW